MKKTLQLFNKESLERCANMTPDQILEFLDSYRTLLSNVPEKCQLISLKVEPSLLKAFKHKARLQGIPYQTLIKTLMKQFITEA